MAIKINYDNRSALSWWQKYSRLPSADEYAHFIERFKENNVGGWGFHECLNFETKKQSPLQIYLPPTCIPSKELGNDEFMIFSFTYKSDPDMPASIIGVHAQAKIVNRHGTKRTNSPLFLSGSPLTFHANAPASMSTLIYPVIPYTFDDGRHTPPYQRWGSGRRYLEPQHAKNIIIDALKAAREALRNKDQGAQAQTAFDRQIAVLEAIRDRYWPKKPLRR